MPNHSLPIVNSRIVSIIEVMFGDELMELRINIEMQGHNRSIDLQILGDGEVEAYFISKKLFDSDGESVRKLIKDILTSRIYIEYRGDYLTLIEMYNHRNERVRRLKQYTGFLIRWRATEITEYSPVYVKSNVG